MRKEILMQHHAQTLEEAAMARMADFTAGWIFDHDATPRAKSRRSESEICDPIRDSSSFLRTSSEPTNEIEG